MRKKDSFLMDLENLSDHDEKNNVSEEEDDMFEKRDQNKYQEKKVFYKPPENIDNIANINFNENVDKLLNSTKLKNNKRYPEFLREIEIDKKRLHSQADIKDQIFKNTNT